MAEAGAIKRAAIKKFALPKIQKETDFMLENVNKIQKQINDNDKRFLLSCLKDHFVFFRISQIQIEKIIKKMFYCSIKANDFIFKQDDDATSFFILETGELEVIINNESKKKLKKGDAFGELALLYNAPRSASIKALSDCSMWGIDRTTFRKVVEEINLKEMEENKKFLSNVKFCQNLTTEQKNNVANVLVSLTFKKNHQIVVEGDPGNSFYIIKKGSVGVYKGSKLVRPLYAGDSFGEQALYFAQQRTMTCKSEEEGTICLSLGRDLLTSILGDQVSVIAFRNLQKWAIDKSQYLKSLPKILLEKILDAMIIKNYKKGEIVVQKGKPLSQIFICCETGLRTKRQIMATKGAVFGDELLKKNPGVVKFDDDIFCEDNGMISSISITILQQIVGKINELEDRSRVSHEKKMTATFFKKYKPEDFSLDNLIFIKELGAGQFGTVYLVQDKKIKQLFALKCIQKKQVIQEKLERHIQQEKNVMELSNFPFIMQFVRSFKDTSQVYFLLEFIYGMELFDAIREIGLLDKYQSQYYIGSILLALEYLHMQNIIYRDLKPENMMVDLKGILYLIDMGTAKILNNKTARTFTMIGTPHYMAPEVITGKGYNYLVDFWSVGVVMYEFLCGRVPFGEDAEDPYDIYEEIIRTKLTYPSFYTDRKGKKLMDMLIHKIPEIRLPGNYAALKGNPWFDDFNWDKLLDGELKTPFIPPKDKIINSKKIDEQYAKDIPITKVINEQLKSLGILDKKFVSKIKGWDDDF